MDSLLQFDRISNSFQEAFISTDPNNNKNDDFPATAVVSANVIIKEDKYSLRPRSVRRVTEVVDSCNSSSSSSSGSDSNNGTRTKSLGKSKATNKSKQKQKPAPLSKYRRKTANARERNRMREINQAFETLRRVIPHMQTTQVPGTNEKLTKITTLRLAMKYIASLSAALNGPELGPLSDTLSDYNDLDCLLLESDGDSLPLSDHSSLLTSPDFPEPSLSPVDFSDPCLPGLFTDHALAEPDDFADFLLT